MPPLSANHSSPDRVQVRLPRGLDQGHAAHLRGLVLAVQRHGLLSLPVLELEIKYYFQTEPPIKFKLCFSLNNLNGCDNMTKIYDRMT